MLTTEQADTFAEAVDQNARAGFDGDDVTATADTLADFIAEHGEATETETIDGLTVQRWKGAVCRSVFDLCAGDLYVTDFGEARAALVHRGLYKRCTA